ncbi:MAG: CPBP family glutamic-type intramembrane protease, partial [Patescibacteria group bacterium]
MSKHPIPPLSNIPLFSPLFILTVIILAAYEEMIFRLPLSFVVAIWGKSKILIAAIIVSSVGFGLAHGSLWHVCLQGIGGVILC